MNLDKKKIIGYIIILIVAIGFYAIVMKYNHDENTKIFSNPEYTIGELTYFSDAKGYVGKTPGRPSEIKYVYSINGNKLENKYVAGEYNIPFSGPIVGEKYIVIYLKSNPQESRMLFDYPIKDSTDFQKYMKVFITSPPTLDK